MMIYLRQQWEHKQDQYQPHNGNTRQDSHLIDLTQMEKMNQMRNYGMNKVLKNITHNKKVKRHPHLQTQRMKRMMQTDQLYMSQDQEGGQGYRKD
jgi:putative salt-induced outer membrane protein YdiY